MISVVVFSYLQTLKSMLIEYAATEMCFLDDYSDADPNHKSIRGNGINTFLFHIAQCILFCLTISVKTILIANAFNEALAMSIVLTELFRQKRIHWET